MRRLYDEETNTLVYVSFASRLDKVDLPYISPISPLDLPISPLDLPISRLRRLEAVVVRDEVDRADLEQLAQLDDRLARRQVGAVLDERVAGAQVAWSGLGLGFGLGLG